MARLVDHGLLQTGQRRMTHFNAKITSRHHDHIGSRNDFIEMGHRFVSLDLGNDAHGLTADLLQRLTSFIDIRRITHERQGQIVESLLGSEANILEIFVS